MLSPFAQYSSVISDAYAFIKNPQDLAQKKKAILDDLFDNLNCDKKTILFIGYHPSYELFQEHVWVTDVDPALVGKNATYVAEENITEKSFDIVIALDEYLTFFDEQELKDKIALISKITKHYFITSLRDYKNQDFKTKDFSHPVVFKHSDQQRIFFEHYDYDTQDRNNFKSTNYIINDDSIDIVGPFMRRNLYFKQLAKFSLDSGALNFLVHKNLMHKSIIKRNFEHIITIKF